MSHQDHIAIRHLKNAASFLLVFVGLLSLTIRADAQGVSRVEIVGIPPVIKTPYLASLENKFRNGTYHVQLQYSVSAEIPTAFRFRLQLYRNGDNLVDITSNPVNDIPNSYTFVSFFDKVSFPQSLNDILKKINNKLKQQVLEGGTIPEGTYRLVLRAIPQSGGGNASVVPGIAVFTVRFPKPPFLLSPHNETVVTQGIPTFAWTPVTTGLPDPIDYHFRMVPVYKGQTPLQALTGNRPAADHVLTNRTVYSYTPDNLPLEAGEEYAWRVTAKDQIRNLPFTDEGRSEIGTFVVSEKNTVIRPVLTLNSRGIIPLEPGKQTMIRFTAAPPTSFDRVYLEGFTMKLKPGENRDSLINDWKKHFEARLKEAANNEGNGIQTFRQNISDPASGSVKLNIQVVKNEQLAVAWRLAGKRKGIGKPLYSNLIGMATTPGEQQFVSYHTRRIIHAPTLNMTGLGSGKVVQTPTLNMTGMGSGKVVQTPPLNMTGWGSGKVVQAPTLNMTGLGSGKVVQTPTLNMTGLGSGKVVQVPAINMTGLGSGKVIQTSTLNMTGMGSGKIIQTPTVHMTGMGKDNQ